MAADGRRHVIAIGGGMLVPDGRVPVHMDYAQRLTGRAEPRICVLNTANGDDPQWALRMYDRFAGRPARLSHLALFPMPNVADPEDLLLSQDVIFVGGEHAGGVACTRPGPDLAQGVAGGHRAGRIERRRNLLVRGGNHGFVRP
jgi:hypothetical protein